LLGLVERTVSPTSALDYSVRTRQNFIPNADADSYSRPIRDGRISRTVSVKSSGASRRQEESMNKRVVAGLAFAMLIGFGSPAYSQVRLNAGAGYFGETVTYPGSSVSAEIEVRHTERLSSVTRVATGFYVHPRVHTGFFSEVTRGYRRIVAGGFFVEQSLGVGALGSFYNSDGVFYLDDEGTVLPASAFGNWDFMPSVIFGLGYDLTSAKSTANLVWIRPRVFWQMPFNNIANFHLALEIGYTRTIREVTR